jgi:hypothetical protein
MEFDSIVALAGPTGQAQQKMPAVVSRQRSADPTAAWHGIRDGAVVRSEATSVRPPGQRPGKSVLVEVLAARLRARHGTVRPGLMATVGGLNTPWAGVRPTGSIPRPDTGRNRADLRRYA